MRGQHRAFAGRAPLMEAGVAQGKESTLQLEEADRLTTGLDDQPAALG